jgi:AraC-like DNA-binding protein
MVEIFDNIKKLYRFGTPCEELADHIEFFSESSARETALYAAGQNFTIKMFPSWTPTFWINLGTAYKLRLGKEDYIIHPEEDILLLRDAVAVRHNLPTDHIFTVKFFPGGLEAIFGINQVKFTGKPFDLRNVLPDRILQQVKKSLSFDERKQLLQNFFLSHYCGQRKKDYYRRLVRDSMEIYAAGNMNYNTSQVAERVFLSSKTINRYFNTVVGTAPKKYFSTLRARAALSAYVADRQAFRPTDFGYHDSSHFYKGIINFTGQALIDQR